MSIKKIIALSTTFILFFGLTAFATAEEPAAHVAAPAATQGATGQDTELSDLDFELQAQSAPEEGLYGDWYGILHGLTLVLTLQEDGTYTLIYPEVSKEPTQGTWVLDDGFMYMDGETLPSISVMREVLSWTVPAVLFEREAQETYKPAEVDTEAVPEDFSGYWESTYIDLDGALLRASELLDNTFIYIEGTNAALGGSIFKDVIAEFIFADAAMTYEETNGNMSIEIKMQLLEDGMLSVALTSAVAETDETYTLHLLLAPAYNAYAISRAAQQ